MLLTRRSSLILGAGALVAACSGQGGAGGGAASAADMTLASAAGASAPILIEYASLTCPHCADFHAEAWERLKQNYIDPGRIRFVYREFPTNPAPVAVAGFQVARCGGATVEQYFDRLGVLYAQQRQILSTGSYDGVRAKLVEIGQAAGLSAQAVEACIADESGAQRIRQVVDDAVERYNVTGTPTFVLNDEKLEIVGPLTYETLSAAIDAKLGG